MRNSRLQETPVLRDVLQSIARQLPASWTLKTRAEVPTAGRILDAIVELTGPSGEPARFAVEVKGTASVASGTILSTLRDIKRAAGLPVLFASQYVGPTLRDSLAAEGFSYADTTGWIRLVLEDPLVLVTAQGADRAPRNRAGDAVTRMNGRAASRTIRTLAVTDLPIGVRDLASAAQVSPGSVSKLLSTLADEDIVERDAAGKTVAVRRRALIRRWARDYSFTTTNPGVAYFIAPRGLTRTLDRLTDAAPMTLTGSAATRALLAEGTTPVVPMTLLALYTADPRELASTLGLIGAEPGTANVVAATPLDQSILPDDGVAVAPVPLVIADLLTLPGRGDSEAEQLLDALTVTDPAWKDFDDSPPEYVAARRVLLDALDALKIHLDNLVLVGVQAVYHHTGDADLNVPLMTTDADLAINTEALSDVPEIGETLRAAGFAPGQNPGHWVALSNVAVDLMVVPHQSGTTRATARAARLAPHEKSTARIAHGLEPALVDAAVVTITALDPQDTRRFDLSVAGPAALLTAKAIKLGERLDQAAAQPDRLKEKDALDAFRLLQAVGTGDLVRGFQSHLVDSYAAAASREALGLYRATLPARLRDSPHLRRRLHSTPQLPRHSPPSSTTSSWDWLEHPLRNELRGHHAHDYKQNAMTTGVGTSPCCACHPRHTSKRGPDRAVGAVLLLN